MPGGRSRLSDRTRLHFGQTRRLELPGSDPRNPERGGRPGRIVADLVLPDWQPRLSALHDGLAAGQSPVHVIRHVALSFQLPVSGSRRCSADPAPASVLNAQSHLNISIGKVNRNHPLFKSSSLPNERRPQTSFRSSPKLAKWKCPNGSSLIGTRSSDKAPAESLEENCFRVYSALQASNMSRVSGIRSSDRPILSRHRGPRAIASS